MNGIKGIFYREMRVLKSRIYRNILASSVSPLLFLLAFGYGIGRNSSVGETGYIDFLIPGLVAMTSMNQSYGISSDINISRFYFKTFDEYLLAPVARWEIIAGEVIYGIIKGLIPVMIVLTYGYIAGMKHIPSLMLVPSLLIHLIIFSILGIMVALKVKNHGDQFAVNAFIITPMTFLSGTFFPVEKMPSVIKYIAHIFPLTYTTSLIRGSVIGTEIDYLLNFGVSALIAGGFFWLCLHIVREMEP
ncbi:ABC transporter permease [Seleniivibrio woodruffii]|uniref:Transport permease protein n=1 Tax=Seleniivibrio woodruffii TaxID=1078050 RepID=A0A4R1K8U1_9BACT|nr:ABC transporter permease [Seleniivibrio woodruffii]TCK60755.1 ABC-type multidrug transport system permease subunit [Seleniivibrio woodruffii]TVZ36385.1 ABC-type multidrug transport system permease subunit [Seleniivibrio woodruffii]